MRVDDYTKRIAQSSLPTIVLDDKTLRSLQLAELEIADDIASYCDQHEIAWTLGGGSVLGAARHGGFIPWDDDIDINMPRESWERFRYGFMREFNDKYRLWSPKIDSNCNVNAIKVYKRGTRLRELSVPEDEERGIFVDIFIIEDVPNNVVLRAAHGVLCELLRYACSCRRIYEQRDYYEFAFAGNDKALKGFRFRSRVGKLLSFASCNLWVQASDKVNGLYRNPSSRKLSIPTGQRRYFGELIDRKCYFPSGLLEFEGRVWGVPADCNEYLTNLYGNWTEIPPLEEREQHVLLELDLGQNDS